MARRVATARSLAGMMISSGYLERISVLVSAEQI